MASDNEYQNLLDQLSQPTYADVLLAARKKKMETEIATMQLDAYDQNKKLLEKEKSVGDNGTLVTNASLNDTSRNVGQLLMKERDRQGAVALSKNLNKQLELLTKGETNINLYEPIRSYRNNDAAVADAQDDKEAYQDALHKYRYSNYLQDLLNKGR